MSVSLNVQFAICLFANIKNRNSASKSDKEFYSLRKCLISASKSPSSWSAASRKGIPESLCVSGSRCVVY